MIYRMRTVSLVCATMTILLCCVTGSDCLIVQGEWSSTNEMFHFLAKFGFQKTNPHEGASSEGYIFGNITTLNLEDVHVKASVGEAVLVLLPRQFFENFYNNATQHTKAHLDTICQHMFKELWAEAYDARCQDTGREDFLRHVPCPVGGLCPDEDNPSNVVAGAQLTYAIKDVNNPRFWYLSLAACRLNESCAWQYSGPGVRLVYHLTLVNGKPPAAGHGFFAYHFSCDQQEVGVLILFCLLVYFCLLLPVQLYATCKQPLRALEVLTVVLLLQAVGLVFATTAQVVMGASGSWLGLVWATGELCTLLCESLFLLLLLLLARGWAVTRSTGHHTHALYLLWGGYTAFTILLYTANKVLQPVVEASYQYGSWPGISALVLRGLLTAWYLWELRETMLAHQHPHTLQFLLQLGAATLVWLVYLPVVVLIAVQVSALWRHKLLLGFRYSADLLAHVFMAYTLYPRRTHPYLVLATPADHCDELDMLDQAPHALHRQWAGHPQTRETDEEVHFIKSTVLDSSRNNNTDNIPYSDHKVSKFKVQVGLNNRYPAVQSSNSVTHDILDPSQEDLNIHVGPSFTTDSGAILSSLVRPYSESVICLGHSVQADDAHYVAALIDLGNDGGSESCCDGEAGHRQLTSYERTPARAAEGDDSSSHSGSDSQLMHCSGNSL